MERRAYVCRHKDCGIRVFLFPNDPAPPRCPNGHGKMQRQANMPYAPSKRKS